jgi:hypothetical protein
MAWQLWNRHRLGLSISVGCLLFMVAFYPPFLRAFPAPYVLVVSLMPPALISVYIANLLLFTDEVGSLTSGYPRRMFTLPVTTGTLVFWPMLIAATVVVSLWLVISLAVYSPGGYHPPLVLPTLAIALAMVWNQAVCWSPIKSQATRLYAAIIGYLLVLGAPSFLFFQRLVSPTSVTVLCLIELPIVYAVALLAVRHDRRGNEWSFGLERGVNWLWATFDRLSKQPPFLHTAAEAQVWYESRCHGLMIKGTMYCVLCSIFLMYLPVPKGKTLATYIALGSMLGMPFLMSNSSGATLGRMRPGWSRQRGFITFQAMRPILTGDMIDAKYRMIARSVAEIWLIDLAMTAALVLVKGLTGDVALLFRSFMAAYPGGRWAAILGLVVVLAPVLTWKQLTDSLVPGLTGRRWLADGSVFVSLVFLLGLISAGLWLVEHPSALNRLLPALIWLMAIFVVVKLVLAILAFRLAVHRGLLSPRSISRIAAIWAMTALATTALVHLLLPATGLSVARPVALLGSLSLLPLGRFALAPLALDWNRHR